MRECFARPYVVAALLVVLAPLLGACGAHIAATVQDRSAPLRQPTGRIHEVRSGDTLYSIAWETGRDYRDIAEWNDLDSPYVIKPGQKIRLYPPSRRRVSPEAEAGYRIVAKGDTLYGIAKDAGVRYTDLAAWNGISPPYTIAPGQRLRLRPPSGAADSSAVRSKPRARSPKASHARNAGGRVHWRWPASGKIIARFAPDDGTKGIDIAGASGQPIYAAASGRVVYQGSGLRGYGQLIIIKHNVDFLSAYAHCAAIYVREGSVIKTGQKIATMGSSGADRVKLHFEIRRRGVPVDPLEHLPKK